MCTWICACNYMGTIISWEIFTLLKIMAFLLKQISCARRNQIITLNPLYLNYAALLSTDNPVFQMCTDTSHLLTTKLSGSCVAIAVSFNQDRFCNFYLFVSTLPSQPTSSSLPRVPAWILSPSSCCEPYTVVVLATGKGENLTLRRKPGKRVG